VEFYVFFYRAFQFGGRFHPHTMEFDEEMRDLHPFQSIYNTLSTNRNFQEVMAQMKNVSLHHLGVDETYLNNLTFAQCMIVVETEKFDVAAFLLPAGFILSLHDHPKMVVCSKLICGSVSIRSFTKIQNLPNDEMLTKLEMLEKTNADEPWFLSPNKGNFHEITPLTPCVLLDILLPPYNDTDRQCNYYSALKKDTDPSNWVLKALPPMLQDQVQQPYMVPYTGYKPS
jgi:hypothetical protein